MFYYIFAKGGKDPILSIPFTTEEERDFAARAIWKDHMKNHSLGIRVISSYILKMFVDENSMPHIAEFSNLNS